MHSISKVIILGCQGRVMKVLRLDILQFFLPLLPAYKSFNRRKAGKVCRCSSSQDAPEERGDAEKVVGRGRCLASGFRGLGWGFSVWGSCGLLGLGFGVLLDFSVLTQAL